MSVTPVTNRSRSNSTPTGDEVLPADDQLDALAAVRLSANVSEDAFRVLRAVVFSAAGSRRQRAITAVLLREAIEIMSIARRDCLPSTASDMHRWMLQANAVLSDLENR